MRGRHDIAVVKNTAADAVQNLRGVLTPNTIKRAVGAACTDLTVKHLNAMPHNKHGWPPTNFYQGAARGTGWDLTDTGIIIYIDNEKAPGGMRQRYHGGPIYMKDKYLTIPAAAPFYGHRATEFTNLRFVRFGTTETRALVVGRGGVGQVNFATGKERNVKGAGARAAGMVAYWLRSSVKQVGDRSVIPMDSEYRATALKAIATVVGRAQARGGRRK